MGGCFGAGGRAGDVRRPSGCVDAVRTRAAFLLGWGEAGNLALLAHVMPVLFRFGAVLMLSSVVWSVARCLPPHVVL